MSSGKDAPTVLVTTHLPADFQGDVKSDTELDSSLFPHSHRIQEQTALSLPLAGRMQHTYRLLKSQPILSGSQVLGLDTQVLQLLQYAVFHFSCS